jgi:hypothetical protein
MLIDVAIPEERNLIKKEAETFLKQNKKNTESEHVECESKSDTSNSWGDWNRFKITQTIPEQHTGEARN